ncbi:MAG: glycosyltransferase [Sphingobacteriaceae bacterium]|nr:glycosyltransferase [Sphingobacteriaceae bacterium]
MKFNSVFIHQQIIPEYRIPIFNAILEGCKQCYIIYGNSKKGSSLKNGKIPSNKNYIKKTNWILPGKRNYFITSFYLMLIKFKPKIIITQYSPGNLNIFILYLLRPIFKFKLIGWYHGWNREKGFRPSGSFDDKLRHFMLKKADGIILYSNEAKEVLKNYKEEEKIFVANNTLDTNHFEKLRTSFELIGRASLKNEINFTSRYNLIFSGRLEESKKPMQMLEVFAIISTKCPDVMLHIIGSGPLETPMKEYVKKEKLERIKFYGSIYNDEITGKMIYCSDMMIIPRWVGLSIIHSFAFECPLLTFESTYHPPEICYLKNEINGFILGNHKSEEIANTLYNYLIDSNKHVNFKKAALEVVKTEAKVDNMVNGVLNAINYFSEK